jgi:hypothetical protein
MKEHCRFHGYHHVLFQQSIPVSFIIFDMLISDERSFMYFKANPMSYAPQTLNVPGSLHHSVRGVVHLGSIYARSCGFRGSFMSFQKYF